MPCQVPPSGISLSRCSSRNCTMPLCRRKTYASTISTAILLTQTSQDASAFRASGPGNGSERLRTSERGRYHNRERRNSRLSIDPNCGEIALEQGLDGVHFCVCVSPDP